jgi:hypothetical protein
MAKFIQLEGYRKFNAFIFVLEERKEEKQFDKSGSIM